MTVFKYCYIFHLLVGTEGKTYQIWQSYFNVFSTAVLNANSLLRKELFLTSLGRMEA